MAAVAAVIVIITGVISLAWNWGILVIFSLLAGVGVLFLVLQPQVAPTMTMPMAKGLLMLVLGAVSVLILVVVALDWAEWIAEHLASVDTLQFLVGLVAAVVMLFAGWRAYQAERGAAAAAGPTATPPAPPPPAAS